MLCPPSQTRALTTRRTWIRSALVLACLVVAAPIAFGRLRREEQQQQQQQQQQHTSARSIAAAPPAPLRPAPSPATAAKPVSKPQQQPVAVKTQAATPSSSSSSSKPAKMPLTYRQPIVVRPTQKHTATMIMLREYRGRWPTRLGIARCCRRLCAFAAAG